MSAAPAANQAEGNAPKKGSKKLLIIVAVVVVVLLLAGVGAFLLMKKNMAHEEGDEGDAAAQVEEAKAPTKKKPASDAPPIFVPLDPFIVNLADRETERFAQIGINLQVDDANGDFFQACEIVQDGLEGWNLQNLGQADFLITYSVRCRLRDWRRFAFHGLANPADRPWSRRFSTG